MDYERAEGAPAVEELLHRIAEGVAKGEVDVAGVTIVADPAVEATAVVAGDTKGKLTSVVVRLTCIRLPGRPTALEREVARPGG